MGSRSAHSVSKGSCDKITVNCCVNAAGGVLPLMIIFKKYFPSTACVKEGPLHALKVKVANRYIDQELFLK